MENREKFTVLFLELINIFEPIIINKTMITCSGDTEDFLKFKGSLTNFKDAIKSVLERITKGRKNMDNNLSSASFYDGWYSDYREYVKDYNEKYFLREFTLFVDTLYMIEATKNLGLIK
jgi:hypothetical protein